MADGDKTAQPGDIKELLGGLSDSDSSSDDDDSGDSSDDSITDAQGPPVPTSEEKAAWEKMGYGGAASPVSDGGGGAAAAMTPPPAPTDFEEAALMQHELEFLKIEHEADADKLAAANKTIEEVLAELEASGSDKKKVLAQEKQLKAQFAYTKELQRKLASAEKRNTAAERKANRRSTAGKPAPKLGESLLW